MAVAKRPRLVRETSVTPSVATNEEDVVCNCSQSRCLKRYCECYRRFLPCCTKCTCVNCSNTVEEREMMTTRQEEATIAMNSSAAAAAATAAGTDD
jgi:hypothetical protein